MKHGYVTRILTTNFDPLVIRACALLGEFPAVYDAAASQLFNAAFIPSKAVFYLHGQHTGFVLMHTKEECTRQSEKLEPVFEFTGTSCTWIVAGYSGENDPVFERLTKYSNFDNRLYWLGYKDREPSPQVQGKLLSCNKSAYYLKGYDSDSFFIELTQRLGLFPPELVLKPFTHLDSLMNSVVAYNYDIHEADDTYSGISKNNSDDIINNTREMIRKAISEIEEKSLSLRLSNLLMQDKYDEVISYYENNKEDLTSTEIEQVYWAYIIHGNFYINQVKIKGDEEYQKACERYGKAAEIKPDKHEAWYNWGNALMKQAESKDGEVADRLYKEAYEKYEKAVEINPDKHEVWSNWGTALIKQAKSKGGEAVDQVYQIACDKLIHANELVRGCADYNLACVFALRGDDKQCRKYLESCAEQGYLPESKYLLHDSDLNNVRNCEWFKKYLSL